MEVCVVVGVPEPEAADEAADDAAELAPLAAEEATDDAADAADDAELARDEKALLALEAPASVLVGIARVAPYAKISHKT